MKLFHEYDIRGIYPSELNENFAYKLGFAITSFTKAKKIVIGYDSRNGNLKLFSAISKSFIEQGLDVVHIGIVTRPMLNFIAWKYKFDLGIIITASHNPKEYNGFKFVLRGKSLSYSNGLNVVEDLMNDKSFVLKKSKKYGRVISKDYISEYVNFLSSKLTSEFKQYIKKNNVRIVVDSSNGASGEIVKQFLLKNNIVYELLFEDPNGNFPCHNPNPLDNNALILLSKKVQEFKADFGCILDPDGDRVRFVDDKGEIVVNNYVDCLIIENLLTKKKSVIVHDLIARKILSETIRRNNGKNIISEVGTSNIIKHMQENNAVFGCEMSGHRYFKEMNNFDSGMLTLVHVLNVLYSKKYSAKNLSSIWKKYDKYVDLGEINFKLYTGEKKPSDEEINVVKNNALGKVSKYYSLNKKKLNVQNIYAIDGISVVTKNYWLNVRASNTEPIIRFRVEGFDKKVLLKVKSNVEKLINS